MLYAGYSKKQVIMEKAKGKTDTSQEGIQWIR